MGYKNISLKNEYILCGLHFSDSKLSTRDFQMTYKVILEQSSFYDLKKYLLCTSLMFIFILFLPFSFSYFIMGVDCSQNIELLIPSCIYWERNFLEGWSWIVLYSLASPFEPLPFLCSIVLFWDIKSDMLINAALWIVKSMLSVAPCMGPPSFAIISFSSALLRWDQL